MTHYVRLFVLCCTALHFHGRKVIIRQVLKSPILSNYWFMVLFRTFCILQER